MSERQLFSTLSDGEVSSGMLISGICTLVTSLRSSGNEQLMDSVNGKTMEMPSKGFFLA